MAQSFPFEIIRDTKQRGNIRFAIFDFDGTISTFREGWQEVMHAMMQEYLLPTPRVEQQEVLDRIIREAIDLTTGKQTIYQMIGLREMVLARGGDALEAVDYKAIFNQRLLARIEHRLMDVQSGRLTPLEMMVPRALKILEAMAYGRPVVSTTIGAEGIDVEHGRNILIADDPAGLADAVASLLNNPDKARSIAREGRRLVENRYAWKSIADTMYRKYEQLI